MTSFFSQAEQSKGTWWSMKREKYTSTEVFFLKKITSLFLAKHLTVAHFGLYCQFLLKKWETERSNCLHCIYLSYASGLSVIIRGTFPPGFWSLKGLANLLSFKFATFWSNFNWLLPKQSSQYPLPKRYVDFTVSTHFLLSKDTSDRLSPDTLWHYKWHCIYQQYKCKFLIKDISNWLLVTSIWTLFLSFSRTWYKIVKRWRSNICTKLFNIHHLRLCSRILSLELYELWRH